LAVGLVITPSVDRPTVSIADAFGTATELRSAAEILAKTRADRDDCFGPCAIGRTASFVARRYRIADDVTLEPIGVSIKSSACG